MGLWLSLPAIQEWASEAWRTHIKNDVNVFNLGNRLFCLSLEIRNIRI